MLPERVAVENNSNSYVVYEREKYARKTMRTRRETNAVERGKAACLYIYANLQQGKTSF